MWSNWFKFMEACEGLFGAKIDEATIFEMKPQYKEGPSLYCDETEACMNRASEQHLLTQHRHKQKPF